MLSRDMVDALENLPLSRSTEKALLGHDNRERVILDAVIAYEGGAWDEASDLATAAGIEPSVLPAAYTAALRWAQSVSRGGITAPSP